MQKIVINISTKYDGGFRFSDEAINWLKRYCNLDEILNSDVPSYFNIQDFSDGNIHYILQWYFNKNRTHPLLIELVETLDPEYISKYDTDFAIISIPDGIDFEIIEETNGYEWVQEKTRKWKVDDDFGVTVTVDYIV